MTTRPRFELVQVEGGIFVRFVAVADHQYGWRTERTWPSERRALLAIYYLTGSVVKPPHDWMDWDFRVDVFLHGCLEVRRVDERPHGPNSRCRCGKCATARLERATKTPGGGVVAPGVGSVVDPAPVEHGHSHLGKSSPPKPDQPHPSVHKFLSGKEVT